MSIIVDNWFITPKNKLLAGDLNGKTYTSGITFDRVKKVEDGWIIGKKSGVDESGKVIWTKYILEHDRMDSYFVKNHYNNTVSYLNNFES